MEKKQRIKVPRFYNPWPHQQAAWQRRQSGRYDYYIKLWSRQTGKDTDDIQFCNRRAWDNPGSQSVYVGLDNVWITQNIFKKVIDNRSFWADYPEEYIHPKDTAKEVTFSNNPKGIAEARVKYIGFLNDQQLIGSSYDNFYISETSLYKDNAFSYLQPIWDQKVAMGKRLSVNFNGTPRGIRNVYYEILKTYTGCDDPDDFPGEHGKCFVDKVTIHDVVVPDGNGGYRPLYTPSEIEVIKDRYMRQFGNLNLFEQEYECSFTTVNAGLVYLAIEKLVEEGRYESFNLDTSKPVYVAFDIASKEKSTDATSAIVYQYIAGRMMVYDIYEARGKSLVECIAELSQREYFHLIRFGALPWDSERSASSMTPIEEARQMFPNINWHSLDKERVDRGIQQVRRMLPNMHINSDLCDWLLTCFMNYEYKRLEKADDWAAKPKHSIHSHLMDALRYAVMAINEIDYYQLNSDGSDRSMPVSYDFFTEEKTWDKPWPEHWQRREKRTEGGLYYYE